MPRSIGTKSAETLRQLRRSTTVHKNLVYVWRDVNIADVERWLREVLGCG
jgi:hypothetical protein